MTGAAKSASSSSVCVPKSRPTPTASALDPRKWPEPFISATSLSAPFVGAQASPRPSRSWRTASACCRCRRWRMSSTNPASVGRLPPSPAAFPIASRCVPRLLLFDPKFLRFDYQRADHRARRDAEGEQHMVTGDWRQPDLEVLVVGHEFGRGAIATMTGYRDVAGGANDDGTVVALRRHRPLANIRQVDIEPRI